ncbi:MAG: hypothetical protein M1570_03855 [Chloroflexi bacterium]|nr:hypothetical protein [Chloroflexota bacterium]
MENLVWAAEHRLRRPTVKFAILGCLSWVAYLHLATSYPLPRFVTTYPLTDFGRANHWSPLSLLDFLLSILGAFALYIITWQFVRRHPTERCLRWLILMFGMLFALTLLVMYPITATDLFEYVFHSRVLVHYGQNPLVTPPSAFKGDPFLKTVNWKSQASPYGPLWLLLTVPGSLLAGNDLILNLILMKNLAVVFYVASTLVVTAILRYNEPGRELIGMLLFAWNPLVLFEAPGNGHNDIIMMFFILFAIYLLVRRQWLWVLPVLVASFLVKYVTVLLFLPFLMYCWLAQTGRCARFIYLGKTLALASFVFLILVSPFPAIPSGLLEEANFFSLLAIPTLIFNFFKGIEGDRMAKIVSWGFTSSAYFLLYTFSVRALFKAQQPRSLILHSAWLTTACLALAWEYQPWFTLWPIALGIWVNHRLARRVLLVFTASALVSYAANYLWIWNIRVWQNLQVNLMFVSVIFVPPFLAGVLELVSATRWPHIAGQLRFWQIRERYANHDMRAP